MVQQFAPRLLGSVPIVTSSSHTLFWRYSLANTAWALVVLKDGDADEPYAVFAPVDSTPGPALEKFIMKHAIPSALELGSGTFQRVMTAEHKPLVVIAPYNADTFNAVQARVKEVAKKWRIRKGDKSAEAHAQAHLKGDKHGNDEHRHHAHEPREVVFAWMDADKWGAWLKSMYGFQLTSEAVQQQRVILSDHSVSPV